jgi:hypothetical protein
VELDVRIGVGPNGRAFGSTADADEFLTRYSDPGKSTALLDEELISPR